MSEVRIYVEGGGDRADSRARVRQGFSRFLEELVTVARHRRIRWAIVACGSRASAFDAFRIALNSHPHALNILLIDSEGPVGGTTPWRYLQRHDGWHQPSGADDEQCHFMAQAMEAWLIADDECLQRFYGQGFNRHALPSNQDVEQIEPAALMRALAAATRGTVKGSYHKIDHGPALLAQANAGRVRQVARHCHRLFVTLERRMTEG